MTEKPAIVHITTRHKSFDDRIFFKEARSLSTRYKVLLLSPGRDGELNDMGVNLLAPGTYEGVEMRAFGPPRIKGPIGTSKRKLRAKLGLPAIPDLFGRTTRLIGECGLSPVVLHLHDPDLLPLAGRFKDRYGCRIVFDCHEYYYWYFGGRDFRSGSYFGKGLHLLGKYRRLFAQCDAVISTTETMQAMNWCIRPEILHETIYNATLIAGARERKHGGRIHLVHEGTLSFDRGLDLMMELFKDRWFRDNVSLKVVGTIGDAERRRINDLMEEDPGLHSNLEITGWVPYEKLEEHLDGDIGLIFLDDVPNNYMGLPNKFFNYLGAGMPIISIPQLEVGKRICTFGLGVIAERNAESVKKAVLEICERAEWYRANIRDNRQRFLWSAEEPKLFRLYEKLLGSAGG